jgi:hypothetical protein
MLQHLPDCLDHYERSWKERLEKGTVLLAGSLGSYIHNCLVFLGDFYRRCGVLGHLVPKRLFSYLYDWGVTSEVLSSEPRTKLIAIVAMPTAIFQP